MDNMDVININSGDDGNDNLTDDDVVMSEYACEIVPANYDEGVIREDDNGDNDTRSGNDDSDTNSGDDDSDISTGDDDDYVINGYNEGGSNIVRGDDDSHKSDEEEESKVQLPRPKYTVRGMLFI
jgi:hypothetical protein